MKLVKVFLIVFLVASCSSDDSNNNNDAPEPARTSIPDSNFEQVLVDLGIDNAIDGSVVTNSIANITDLVLDDKGISSLTGLNDFTSLTGLWASNNSISSLNVSENTALKFIFVNNNSIASINISSLPDLEKLTINGNNISSLSLSSNLELQQLEFANNNVSAIDVSVNSALNRLNVVGNPLTCIRVNSDQLNAIPSQWEKDPEDEYALSCN